MIRIIRYPQLNEIFVKMSGRCEFTIIKTLLHPKNIFQCTKYNMVI